MEHLTSFDTLMNETMMHLDAEGYDSDKFNKRMIQSMLKSAYIEFVKKSECIISTVEINLQKGVHDYYFFNKDGYNIKKIKNVNLEGCCLKPAKSPCSCGCCKKTYSYSDGWIHLCKAPTCDGKVLEICGSFFPEMSTCRPEKRVIELYGEYIISGAVAKILGKTKTYFTYARYFDEGIEYASHESARSYSRLSLNKGKPAWINF